MQFIMLMCHKNVFSNYVVLDNLGDLHVNESDMEMEEFVMRMKHQLLWIFAPFIWTKKDITSWPWCWIPNSRSCGFPLLMWVVCNLSFGGLLLPLLVECYKFLMLIMFDEPLSQVAMNNEDLFSLTNILKLVL